MSQVDENNPSSKSELDLMFEQIDQTSLAAKYYKAFKQAAGKTLKSIIISCVVRLQSFMTPQVTRLTGSDNINLASIGDEKQSFLSSRRRRTGHLLSLPACYIHSYLKRSIIKGKHRN